MNLRSLGTQIFLMLTREQKKEIVRDLAGQLETARGIVFSDFQGLATRDSQELREALRKQQVRHRVVKINLLKIALARAGIDTAAFNFHVPLAVSVSTDDEIAPAKTLANFAKTHPQLNVLGGILDRKMIDAAQVKKLATLPGKTELLGQVVNVISSPLRGLASVLQGNFRGLVNVLNAKNKLI